MMRDDEPTRSWPLPYRFCKPVNSSTELSSKSKIKLDGQNSFSFQYVCFHFVIFFVMMDSTLQLSCNRLTVSLEYDCLIPQECFPCLSVLVFFGSNDDKMDFLPYDGLNRKYALQNKPMPVAQLWNIDPWPKPGVIGKVCSCCDIISSIESAVICSQGQNYKKSIVLNNYGNLCALWFLENYTQIEQRRFHHQHLSIFPIVLILVIIVWYICSNEMFWLVTFSWWNDVAYLLVPHCRDAKTTEGLSLRH